MHDGPVREMAKCPFMPHLLLTAGGYSFAVWNEGVMVCLRPQRATNVLFVSLSIKINIS